MIFLFVFGNNDPAIQVNQEHTINHIATHNSNYLYAVEGNPITFKELNPTAREYYDADWEQNAYPKAPGDTPLEKYLNGINGVDDMTNYPKWNEITPAIANSPLFAKIMTTTNTNAFTALQASITFRDMKFFQILLTEVIKGIPDFKEEDLEQLNSILIANNFPVLT